MCVCSQIWPVNFKATCEQDLILPFLPFFFFNKRLQFPWEKKKFTQKSLIGQFPPGVQRDGVNLWKEAVAVPLTWTLRSANQGRSLTVWFCPVCVHLSQTTQRLSSATLFSPLLFSKDNHLVVSQGNKPSMLLLSTNRQSGNKYNNSRYCPRGRNCQAARMSLPSQALHR